MAHGRIRRMVAGAAITGAVFVSAEAASGDAHRSGDFTEHVNVGGYQLFINCTGSGSPAVVLEAGLGGSSQAWDRVQPAVAGFTRVCSYDRAGRGQSDAAPVPRTSQNAVDDVRALLGLVGVPGPYVLVGHSFGGWHVQLFTRQDQIQERQVAGVVLVDTTPLNWPEVGDRLGFPTPTPQENPEGADIRASAQEVHWAPTFPNIPLAVLSHGVAPFPPAFPNRNDAEAAWQDAQRAYARMSSQGELVVAEGAAHSIHRERPDLVIASIKRVVDMARSESRIQAA